MNADKREDEIKLNYGLLNEQEQTHILGILRALVYAQTAQEEIISNFMIKTEEADMADLKAFYSSENSDWSMLGDIQAGRRMLGEMMPVMVYRLMEYSIRDVLQESVGNERMVELFRQAGRIAGIHLTKTLLDTTLDFRSFMEQLQQLLAELKIGILRIERVEKNNTLILTISEDLDCSGLPILGETVCYYDEGFLEGVLNEYTQKEYTAVEVDCWAKGDRVCRFCVTEKV